MPDQRTSRGAASIPTPADDLPRSVADLQTHWRELPPTLTPDQVLSTGWLSLTRAPLYRAISRHEIPAVKLGRRTLILTAPLLKMLGLDLDRPPVGVTGGQACGQAWSPPGIHDVDGNETP
jgi:hypothetical protein